MLVLLGPLAAAGGCRNPDGLHAARGPRLREQWPPKLSGGCRLQGTIFPPQSPHSEVCTVLFDLHVLLLTAERTLVLCRTLVRGKSFVWLLALDLYVFFWVCFQDYKTYGKRPNGSFLAWNSPHAVLLLEQALWVHYSSQCWWKGPRITVIPSRNFRADCCRQTFPWKGEIINVLDLRTRWCLSSRWDPPVVTQKPPQTIQK